MNEIRGFIYTAQIGECGCYGAVAKMVIDCKNYRLISDGESKVNEAISSEVYGNPIVLLEEVVIEDDSVDYFTDDQRIPKIDEIKKEIDSNRPLICCLGVDAYGHIDSKPNTDYQKGHWVIIMGYDDTANSEKIKIADPEDSQKFIEVDYKGVNTVHKGMRFQNTSYVGSEQSESVSA